MDIKVNNGYKKSKVSESKIFLQFTLLKVYLYFHIGLYTCACIYTESQARETNLG